MEVNYMFSKIKYLALVCLSVFQVQNLICMSADRPLESFAKLETLYSQARNITSGQIDTFSRDKAARNLAFKNLDNLASAILWANGNLTSGTLTDLDASTSIIIQNAVKDMYKSLTSNINDIPLFSAENINKSFSPDKSTALIWALRMEHPNLAKVLATNVNSDINKADVGHFKLTPLHWAVFRGDIPTTTTLLRRSGININALDKNGKTAMNYVNNAPGSIKTNLAIAGGTVQSVKPKLAALLKGAGLRS